MPKANLFESIRSIWKQTVERYVLRYYSSRLHYIKFTHFYYICIFELLFVDEGSKLRYNSHN